MRILVIEDELALLQVIAQALRESEYAVDEASDGEEGFYKATSWDYDLLILDLMLPRLDGLTLLSRFRKTHKTPVLILTARDGVNDRVRGLDCGADDYLIKPFALVELLARTRALIRRSVGKANPVIQIGEVTIDTRTRTVARHGLPVILTAREYALLELLVLHQGSLVSRTKIYEHIFDENDDSLSNLVEVHISNIRKKLGKEFIATRRGQGYIIDEKILQGNEPSA